MSHCPVPKTSHFIILFLCIALVTNDHQLKTKTFHKETQNRKGSLAQLDIAPDLEECRSFSDIFHIKILLLGDLHFRFYPDCVLYITNFYIAYEKRQINLG